MKLQVDYTRCVQQAHPSFLEKQTLDAKEDTLGSLVNKMNHSCKPEYRQLWMLPHTKQYVKQVEEITQRQTRDVLDVLVIGMGGSSLGAQAVYEALSSPLPWRNKNQRRLHCLDNSDPWQLSYCLMHCNPSKTLALAISKSGETLETASILLIVQKWFQASDVDVQKHIIIISGACGSLANLAKQKQWQHLEIPASVGGRFSVFSPVGLLPIALLGFDILAFVDGATSMQKRCQTTRLQKNPAAMFATLHVTYHQTYNRNIHVLMPYSDRLKALGTWYIQLWAESLGKCHLRDLRSTQQGPTPLLAIGARDQHSQLQLFLEGPKDKLFTFISVETHNHDIEITADEHFFPWLQGLKMSELLSKQHQVTALALAERENPSITIHMHTIDAYCLGELMYLLQAAALLAAQLYKVHPFDQPGVERCKAKTYDALKTGNKLVST